MRITLAVVGRRRPGPERALYEHYAGRISEQGLARITVKEIEERKQAVLFTYQQSRQK